MRAEVADVKHNLLSNGRLEQHGYGILFLQDQSRIMREDWQAEITRRKDLYQLCGEILAIRRIDAMKELEEMLPIFQEEKTPDTGGASGSGHAIADEENRRLETTSTTESTTRGATYHRGHGCDPPQATMRTMMGRMPDPFEE